MSTLRAELERLPTLLSAHILLTMTALALGVLICIPLAAFAIRHKGARGVILAVASAVQTVPSLAVLALMVAAFGLFDLAAAIPALTAYSILPILRNTITGIEDVDRNVVEAARGIGMTRRQILRRIELPLAAPVIVAGFRTATVWIVGIATLSTPVGADSLGNYIFSGLQTRNTKSVLVGVVAAAALALTLDALIRAGEVALRLRSRRIGAGVVIALACILGVGVVPVVARAISSGSRGELVVGAKTFTEQFILARHLHDTLAHAGFPARIKQGLGSSVAFEALTLGEIDAYVDYSGTVWSNYMKRSDAPSRSEMISEIVRWADAEHGVHCLGPLGFENTYALAMRRDRAETLGVDSIDDLAAHAGSMTIAGDYEFFARPEWAAVRDAYGLGFAREQSMDATLMYAAARDGQVDVISAFSTDGRIPAFDLVVLTDPEQALPPYDAILLVSARVMEQPDAIEALRGLIGAIGNREMRRANMIVDVRRRPIREAANTLR